jgi:hypothetical protein
MPHIQILAANGEPYSITSSNPELLAQWIWETIQQITPNEACSATIRVSARWIGDQNGRADWPPNAALVFQAVMGADKPTDNVRGLMSALGHYVDLFDGGRPAELIEASE